MSLLQRIEHGQGEGPKNLDGKKGSAETELVLTGWLPEEIKVHDAIISVITSILKSDEKYKGLRSYLDDIIRSSDVHWQENPQRDAASVFDFIRIEGTGGNIDAKTLRSLILIEAKRLEAERVK